MKLFSCVTFGCRVNQYETQAIREQLLAKGYDESSRAQADVVVINSCTVTAEADKECIRTIRSIHQENPHAQIVVAGCFVQKDAHRLKDLPGVHLLVGSGQKHRLAELIALQDWSQEPRVELELGQVQKMPQVAKVQWEKNLPMQEGLTA